MLLNDPAGVRYRINAQDQIESVDEAWQRFAAANDGHDVQAPGILGRPIWNFISDEVTRRLYRQVVTNVRHGRIARFNLRCDGPATRRLLQMTVEPAGDGSVDFSTSTVWTETRPPVALLSRQTRRCTDLIPVCAWCNRIGLGGSDWVDVEDAVARLGLFERGLLPELTHGICSRCLADVTSTVGHLPATA